ncbi:hypothetical protein EAM_1290 [Erwinia amylovora ATCC 49946]|nr:hypothetical protein EAM_1290 [Erwinia amylovora ATCC 49946]
MFFSFCSAPAYVAGAFTAHLNRIGARIKARDQAMKVLSD